MSDLRLSGKIRPLNLKQLLSLTAAACLLFGAGPARSEEDPPPVPKQDIQVERGQPVWPLDALGNLLSISKKVILLNAKVDSHRISPKTEETVQEFIASNPEELGDLKVRLNQWSPVGDMARLVKNKRVEWYFRVFPGIPVTLWSSLTGRILGGDHYNPYTNTVHLFSDDKAIALHELGHAKDFAKNPAPGLYAVGRLLPPIELTQEQVASDIAIEHLKQKKDKEGELHAYSTLYPAFGTYGGQQTGLAYGSTIGAGVGHILGWRQRYESRLGYEALESARPGVSRRDELFHTLVARQEESRALLIKSLQKKNWSYGVRH